jgi:hypothetical protein
MIVQLNPQLPVFIEGKGTGYAFAMIDYSQDHYLHFVIAMDDSGEIWTVPNNKVKMQFNYSLGRNPHD